MIDQGANGELKGAKGLLFAVVTKVASVHVDDHILLMNNIVSYIESGRSNSGEQLWKC